MEVLERRAALTGVGQSEIGRRLYRDSLELTLDACLAAIAQLGAVIDACAAVATGPLNTHGGQLSAGRLHGFGFLHEACVQLWGEGGDRQVPGDPEVAVAAAGGGPLAGCLLLTRT
jgi:hypothetical protein